MMWEFFEYQKKPLLEVSKVAFSEKIKPSHCIIIIFTL